MALNMDDLDGVIGEVICETRSFEDSWGMPGLKITGVVLRADHPDWRQYTLEVQARRPEVVKSREAVNERVFHGLAPKGFRQAKKVSEFEAHQRMLGKIAQTEKLQIEILSLREQKAGIAEILCKDLKANGESIARRGGVEYDLSTAKGRAAFFEHTVWEFDQDGIRKEVAIPVYKKGPDGKALLSESGEPLKNDCGGWNIGDAIAQLILDEAEDTAKFVEERKADALEQSGDTSIGPSASGSVSMSADAES